jgi:hypothetical protein
MFLACGRAHIVASGRIWERAEGWRPPGIVIPIALDYRGVGEWRAYS